MNNERRTRAESTRTHNRSTMSAQNAHPQNHRDVKHPKGQVRSDLGLHRDNEIPKAKKVTQLDEKEDLNHAFKSSDRFANSYSDETQDKEVDDTAKLGLSGEDEDFGSEERIDDEDDDFGARDFQDDEDDEDIEEIKKSSRH